MSSNRSRHKKKDPKRQRRDDESSSSSGDDPMGDAPEADRTVHAEAIQSFIPGENIDTHVLVTYVARYIDSSAQIRAGQHWKDKTKFGYWMGSRFTLSVANLRDIMLDSRDYWEENSKRRKQGKAEIAYRDSKTAARRQDKGASTPQVQKTSEGQSADYNRQRQGSVQPAFPAQSAKMNEVTRHNSNTAQTYGSVSQSAPITASNVRTTQVGRNTGNTSDYPVSSPPAQQYMDSGMAENTVRHQSTPAPPSYQDATTDRAPPRQPQSGGPKQPSGSGNPGWQRPQQSWDNRGQYQ